MSIASRRLLASLAVVGTAVGLAVGQRAVHAGDAEPARALLTKARSAPYRYEFEGVVRVRWRDGKRARTRVVPVESRGGVLAVGRDALGGDDRLLRRTDETWELWWSRAAPGGLPNPTAKYDFRVLGERGMLGRRAVPVALTDRRDVRERRYFDAESGLLLRRDELDGRGRVVRQVAFVRISDPVPVATPSELPEPNGRRRGPRRLTSMPDDTEAPRAVGDRFRLVDAYRALDGQVQLFYSDGVLAASVFERTGELAWDALGAGGRGVELGGHRARAYASATGTTVVWEDDGVVYTCVTDAPLSEIGAIVQDLHAGDPGLVEQIGRFVTGPFSWD